MGKIITQNGVKTPRANTKANRVWEIASYYSNHLKRPATEAEVLGGALAEKIAKRTIITAYRNWRVFYGLPETEEQTAPEVQKTATEETTAPTPEPSSAAEQVETTASDDMCVPTVEEAIEVTQQLEEEEPVIFPGSANAGQYSNSDFIGIRTDLQVAIRQRVGDIDFNAAFEENINFKRYLRKFVLEIIEDHKEVIKRYADASRID